MSSIIGSSLRARAQARSTSRPQPQTFLRRYLFPIWKQSFKPRLPSNKSHPVSFLISFERTISFEMLQQADRTLEGVW